MTRYLYAEVIERLEIVTSNVTNKAIYYKRDCFASIDMAKKFFLFKYYTKHIASIMSTRMVD